MSISVVSTNSVELFVTSSAAKCSVSGSVFSDDSVAFSCFPNVPNTASSVSGDTFDISVNRKSYWGGDSSSSFAHPMSGVEVKSETFFAPMASRESIAVVSPNFSEIVSAREFLHSPSGFFAGLDFLTDLIS